MYSAQPDLPPPYIAIALREAGDAFAHACALAPVQGAGTLVWVRRYDLAECAVVLEPAEPLDTSMQVIFAGMNALADALASLAPPEKPIELDWPDAVRFDGGLVGGGRLAWPEGCAPDEAPSWLVFGVMLRAGLPTGLPPDVTPPPALREEGFDDFDSAEFVGRFARHLMVALDEWSSSGPDAVRARWATRASGHPAGDLAASLRQPSWLDPATGEIRA
jgi:hypothetical protein